MIEAAYPLLASMAGGTPRRDKKIVIAIYREMVETSPSPVVQGMTRNQRKVHLFLEDFIATHQISPSYREIAKGCGFGGKDEAFRVAVVLERKGIIKRRGKGETRGIVVLIPSGRKLTNKYKLPKGSPLQLKGPRRAT